MKKLLFLLFIVTLINCDPKDDEIVDTTAPVITLIGDNPATVELGSTYIEAGASADGGETVTTSGTVDTNTVGTYEITYSATDGTNTGTATRIVDVVATKFRSIYNNTFWLVNQTVLTFSPDKLMTLITDDNPAENPEGFCVYFLEGSYNDVQEGDDDDDDACFINNVTLVLVEETADSLIFKQTTSNCLINGVDNAGEETTITIEVDSENSLNVTLRKDDSTEQITITLWDDSLPTTSCTDGILVGFLL
jgi:hypothetical protein|tara:strand:+ start:1271 stop:2020 length:750 start_codon:yes stop_codon:yes gene_type:complete